MVYSQLNMSQQCTQMAKKANSILDRIRNNVANKTSEVMSSLWDCILRVAFSLEPISRRKLRCSSVYREMRQSWQGTRKQDWYEECLKKLKLFSLEKGDFITVFKRKKIVRMLMVSFLGRLEWGNTLKLHRWRFKLVNRKNWNGLLREVVGSPCRYLTDGWIWHEEP